MENVTFGKALEMLKRGSRVTRSGWNGKGQWVVRMPELQLPPYSTQDTNRKVNDRTAKWIGEDAPLNCRPYYVLFNNQGEWQPGWLPSQGDLEANDWIILD